VGEEVLDHPPPQRLAELGGFRQHVHQAFDGRGRIRAWAVRRPQHHDDLASLVRSDVEIRDQRASILVGISLQIILDPLVEFLMRAGELACQTTYDQSAEQILWDDIAPHRIASEGGNADRGVPFRAASPGNAKPLPGGCRERGQSQTRRDVSQRYVGGWMHAMLRRYRAGSGLRQGSAPPDERLSLVSIVICSETCASPHPTGFSKMTDLRKASFVGRSLPLR